MPTSKESQVSKNLHEKRSSKMLSRPENPTVSELKLDLPISSKNKTKIISAKAVKPMQGKEYCDQSSDIVTMQNLELQLIQEKKPIIKTMTTQKNTIKHMEATLRTSLLNTHKMAGYDLTSSTNSNFKGWVLNVPKKQRKKYTKLTTTTSTDVETSTSMRTTAEDAQQVVTSQEMTDSQHDGSQKCLHFKGAEWKKPCKESLIAGAPKPFVGTCPLNYEALAKMSKARQKFFLTQDPRKKHCLVNPEVLQRKPFSTKREFKTLTKMVKHGDNICEGTESHSSESFICEVIDLENPLQLDFQGLDYKKTYERDEQDFQNQRNYRRVCRYMERKRIKAETATIVENELQAERLAIPQRYAIRNREVVEEPPVPEEPVRYGKLYRSADKPFNKQRITEEHNRRQERYKNLYLARKEKFSKERREQQISDAITAERMPGKLALENFNDAVQDINDTIFNSFKMEPVLRQNVVERKIYPHTLRETLRFKKMLKEQNRIERDTAKVKQEFFRERLGKQKYYPEAALELSSDSGKQPTPAANIGEQSSDDEDDIDVGKKADVIKLRGFHFKLGENLRGKRHQNQLFEGTRKEKGCLTREQWLAELAPKREQIKLDVEKGIPKEKSPDDPDLVLFDPTFGFKPPKAKYSGVRQYLQKRLGRHYERTLRKNLKLVKPRLPYAVKKFNLIGFLYGDATKRLTEMKNTAHKLEREAQMHTTLEYMEARERLKKQQQQLVKQQRLQLLGIECHQVKKSRLQALCENSESESSEWVPEAEPKAELVNGLQDEQGGEIKDLSERMRGNMPAPKYREATLRRHPRKPRDYACSRVPTQLFDQAVSDTGIPHMHKLTEDKQQYANVRLQKRPYTDMFEARHHHDHWNATQSKSVHVHYKAKMVKPEVTHMKNKVDKITMQNFQMANPPCNYYVDMELTMPKWNTDQMIAEHLSKAKRTTQLMAEKGTKGACQARDFVFHSRPKENFENLDYPGRQEYLQFLQDIRSALQEETKREHESSQKGTDTLLVDKEALLRELEEDLKSIESCLTSLSSSECTNLSNDSGSFLLMDGKTKVPLDYIRKSLVPFEELQRSRFRVLPIDVDAEESNPFKVLPFPGQRKAQLELTTAKDSFFTFNTRLKNGLRLRLEVPVEDVRKKLLGFGAKKFPGAVTTDIDENYVDELKNRPSVKMFNFKTGGSFIKDALRLKFESMLIQGQIVRTKIYDRLNEQHWENMQKMKILYENLFAKWEKNEYESAMSVVHQVKAYYEITDVLKLEFRDLERQLLILNMDIVFIEGHWIQRVMLQNFHYLLADQDWRLEHDWIHRSTEEREEGEEGEEGEDEVELESFELSIAKRNTTNIRQREKDDAWAIKSFYEDVYLQNIHPILIVFPDAESFLQGIENLKLKTFVLLLELHFTLAIFTELQVRLETFQEWCIQDLKEKEEYVVRKCAKKYFMEDRAEELKRRTYEFLDQPIEMSFNDETFNKDRAVIAEVWRQIVPPNIRGSSDQDVEPVNMVAMISEVVLELIAKFETIPVQKSSKIEATLRRRLNRNQKLSIQAYQVEKRIDIEMKKVRKNLEPPYQRPKRVGRLPRVHIKKIIRPVIVPEKRITEHTKCFFRAFHDEGDISELEEARESLYVIDTIQEQIVPFYFDHFLKLNGYTPNYSFKTHAEIRDGVEMDRLMIRSLVPELQDKMERWERARKKIMKDNIARNPKMYENVNF